MRGSGTARGEGELVRSNAEGGRGGLPRRVEELTRTSSLGVEPLWVGPAVVEGGQQGLSGDRVQWRGGGGVQVDRRGVHGTPRYRLACLEITLMGADNHPNRVQPVLVE